MSDSQKFIARNRAPRVQIEYDVELYGSEKKVQLPFVMGVLSDLSGKSKVEPPSVADRQFLEIDVDNFDDRMRAMAPRVAFTVPNTLNGEGNLAVDLTFEKMSDFEPAAIADRIEPLRGLLEARRQLADLMAYMDGKAGAEKLIETILADPSLLSALSGGAASDGADTEAALARLRALSPPEPQASDRSDTILADLAASAPAEAAPEDDTGQVLAGLADTAPEDAAPDDEAARVLGGLAASAPAEAAPEDEAASVLADLSTRASEAPPEDTSADVLAGLAASAPGDAAPEDTASDVLAGLAASAPEEAAPEDASSDILADLSGRAPAEGPGDDNADVLAGLAASAPNDAAPEVTASDVFAELSGKAPSETPEDDGADVLAGLAASAAEAATPEDTASDILSELSGSAPTEAPEDNGADVLAGIAALASEDATPEDTASDILADLSGNAPTEADKDHGADILAGLAASAPEDATSSGDTASDILTDLSTQAPTDKPQDDGADALASLAGTETEKAPAEDGSSDILSGLAAQPAAGTPEDDDADILAGLTDPVPDDTAPENASSDILAGLAEAAPDETAPEDASSDVLAELSPQTPDASDDGLDDLLGDLGGEVEPAAAAETANEVPGDGLDDLLGDLGGEAEPAAAAEAVSEASDDGLDDPLGDLGGEAEPAVAAEAVSETAGDGLGDLLGDLGDEADPAATAEASSEATGDGLDDLLGDLGGEVDPAATAEAVSDTPGDGLDDLLGDLGGEADPAATAEAVSEAPGDGLDDLLGDLGGEADPAATAEAASDTPGDGLDDLLGDLGGEAEPATAVETALDAPADDLDDLLADIPGDPAVEAPQADAPAQPAPEPELVFGTMSAERPSAERLNRKRFRIALFGDFTGRAAKGVLETGAALAAREPVLLDPDTVEEIIEGFAGDLTLPVGRDGAGVRVPVRGLDDLHPDEIFGNAGIFAELNGLRGQLQAGATAAGALARLKDWAEAHDVPLAATHRRSKATSVPADRKLSDFQKLIGDHSGSLAPDTSASPMDEMIARIVGPHVRRASDADGIAQVDAAISAAMRMILHHPDFQALESQWRSLDLLARSVEADDQLEMMLYDISAEEIAADLAASEDLADSGLVQLLTGPPLDEETGRGGYSAMIGLYTFEETPVHAQILGRVARVAAHVDAPFVAAISPAFLETKKDDRHPLVAEAWDTLRDMPEAAYLALAAPRFMLRRPYGAKTEPTYEFDFEEFTMEEGLRGLLWANPAVLVTILMAQSFRKNGPGLDLGSVMSLGGIPYHYVTDRHGDQVALPCTERNLTLSRVEDVMARGVMPVVWIKGRDEIRLGSFNAMGGETLRGPWTGTPPPQKSPPKPQAPAAAEANSDASVTEATDTLAELDDILSGFSDDAAAVAPAAAGDGDIDAELAALLEDL